MDLRFVAPSPKVNLILAGLDVLIFASPKVISLIEVSLFKTTVFASVTDVPPQNVTLPSFVSATVCFVLYLKTLMAILS